MEENNRINRRSRPRPYDLRRKVLLKNFLREQMTYIPSVQIEPISQNDDVNNLEQPVMPLHLVEDLKDLNNENSSSIVVAAEQDSSNSSGTTDSTPHIPDFTDNRDLSQGVTSEDLNLFEDVSSSADVSTSNNVINESGFYKLGSLLKRTRDSRKKHKGIGKAKQSFRNANKSHFFKTGFERVFNRYKRHNESLSHSTKPKTPPRSLFALFKFRKAQRNTHEFDRFKHSGEDYECNSVRARNFSANQSVSVQTEDNWAKEELFRVQQSNRLLREENRLLSESLSYFMSSSSMDSQMNHCSSPLQSSNKNTFNGYYDTFSSNLSNNWNSRSRISRSKSVQEHSERRSGIRNNYRTRSMNCHNVRNKVLLPDPKPRLSTFNHQPEGYVPRIRRKSILGNVPENNSVRGIQRRSSMPERNLSENDRSVICRRSESFRDTYRRKPFYSLPSEAFY